MERLSTKARFNLLWIQSNAESAVALLLAVTMSVLGIVDLIPADLVSKVIPLTLGVVAFAVLRDRWRQESVNAEIQNTVNATDATLRRLHERLDQVMAMDGLLVSTQRALDGLAAVRFAIGEEVTDALARARAGTDRWFFRGGTGTHARVVTLPDCFRQAQEGRREVHVRMEILDPTDLDACNRYANLYRSLAWGKEDDAHSWTGEGTRIELYATILAACWFKKRAEGLMEIEVALTSSVSMFRWELSSNYLIVTQRGPRFPAMIFERGRPFYDSWAIELRTSFNEARRVPLERACTISLLPEPSVEVVPSLFRALGLDLPDDYGDEEIRLIIEKALRDDNPSLRGAGDNLTFQPVR
ncbi:hypothetical protein [Nocardia blacklockiae]|uniref:hypothetical protein n=1 Tax=Nocardia blacklockiae TaxID=480036 RepID=UPI00189374C6|nr:hypothetical protein [Nocardia blacklockiae]MBF6174834.1 hypothetical protein [Nocardia blacklockiae]